LPTTKRFKFIFVGATVFRKGIDILLRAYRQAFSAGDDVCLVIKDHLRDVFYKGISYREEIAKLQSEFDAPEILYLNDFISASELGSLYRACDAAVFPYRAEGFGIPILEAMACGVPPIVPKFGACLDFCSASNAFLMPVRRISLPVQGSFAFNTLGFRQEVKQVDFAEVPVNTLAEFMRRAYTLSPEALQRKANAGVERAHNHFTWADSTAAIVKQIAALERHNTPYRLRQQRSDAARRIKKQEAAQKLYQSLLKQISVSTSPARR
jgi:glycosyltransferase involved in cell wall biosynthesis